MCIYVKKKDILTADEDIKCYKVLYKKGDKWLSPYQRKDYSGFIGNGLIVSDNAPIEQPKLFIDNSYLYDRGFLHTFKYNELINILVKKRMNCNFNEYKIFECIIPKGTAYLTGYDGDNKECYASRCLKINEMIKD